MSPTRTTIRRKLMTSIMVTSGAVLVLTCAAFITYEIVTLRRGLVTGLAVRADLVGANSTAALAFQNPQDATTVLETFRGDPRVVAAAVYDAEGRLFAWYPPEASPATYPATPAPQGHRFGSKDIVVYRPVLEDGRRLGTVYLRFSLSVLSERYRAYSILVPIVLACAILLAFVLSSWLQRRITAPLQNLADSAREITETRDYSRRPTEQTDDEIGVLTDSFNDMLDEIQRREQNLEQDVADRTAELEAANHELKAANRELEAFSYSVSHDLRAPLRAIDGFSNLLLEDYADRVGDEGRRYLERVRGATRSMSQLIDDLLNLARLSKAEVQRQRVDLSALGREVARSLTQAQPERDVLFQIADGLSVDGDPQLLKVVVDNLLRNAWKFTSKHPSARIELGRTHADGTLAYFVRDDGAGFDMAHEKHLFQPFHRLHPPQQFEGTGVGLATVQRVIERHGGHVWADAGVEKGATFYFTLWDKPTADPAAPSGRPSTPVPQVSRT